MLGQRLVTRPAIMAGLLLLFVQLGSRQVEAPYRHPALRAWQAPDTMHVVLAEVLFAPNPGDTSFIELLNAGTAPVKLESMVLKIDTLVLPLPRLAAPLAPGARALVRFDGRPGEEGNLVHASTSHGL